MLVHLSTYCTALHRDFAGWLKVLGEDLCYGLKGSRFLLVWRFVPNLRVVTLPSHASAKAEQHRETTASWMGVGRRRAQGLQGRSHHFDPWWQHLPVLFWLSCSKVPMAATCFFLPKTGALKMFTPGCYCARKGNSWNVYAGGKLDLVQPDVCWQSQIQTWEQTGCYFPCGPI